jgi:hypothetical protein
MKNTTLLMTVVLAIATLLTAGSVVLPRSAQGSDVSTDADDLCAGNVITPPPPPPTTDDSEELDSDINCDFYGPGDIEGGGQQVPPDTDNGFAP